MKSFKEIFLSEGVTKFSKSVFQKYFDGERSSFGVTPFAEFIVNSKSIFITGPFYPGRTEVDSKWAKKGTDLLFKAASKFLSDVPSAKFKKVMSLADFRQNSIEAITVLNNKKVYAKFIDNIKV